jgi:hypothetical protein
MDILHLLKKYWFRDHKFKKVSKKEILKMMYGRSRLF